METIRIVLVILGLFCTFALFPFIAGAVVHCWHRRLAVTCAVRQAIRHWWHFRPAHDPPSSGHESNIHPSVPLPPPHRPWDAWRYRRAQRYLQTHHALAVDVLRTEPAIATAAVAVALSGQAMDAARAAPQRETWPFPQLAQMGYGGRSPLLTTLPKLSSFALRRFSEYPPARRAINALSNPILDLPWTVALRRPLGGLAHDVPPEPTDEQQRRIVAVTEMLSRPNNEQTWREALEMTLEDLLILGGGVWEFAPNVSDARPLFFWPVDAQSVRINANWRPGSTIFRYSQGHGYFYSAIGTTDDVKLQDDEMLYMRLNPRTNTPFGYGYLEVAFATINAYIGAAEYAERRASNATPNFGIFLGENTTVEQARRWQHYWENEIEGFGKVPILGGGVAPSTFSLTGTGEDQLYLKYQEWLVRVIAMSFGLSPMRLGIERDVNRSTAQQGSSDDWATIAPVANTVRDSLTHWLLWRRLGYTDLEFQWQVRTADELRQAEILVEQYTMNAITVDEIRQVYERPPLPDGLGDMTKTAYEAAIKAAAGLPAGNGSPPGQDGVPGAKPAVFPFDEDETAGVSPQQAAFLRRLMQEQRRERAVAG